MGGSKIPVFRIDQYQLFTKGLIVCRISIDVIGSFILQWTYYLYLKT